MLTSVVHPPYAQKPLATTSRYMYKMPALPITGYLKTIENGNAILQLVQDNKPVLSIGCRDNVTSISIFTPCEGPHLFTALLKETDEFGRVVDDRKYTALLPPNESSQFQAMLVDQDWASWGEHVPGVIGWTAQIERYTATYRPVTSFRYNKDTQILYVYHPLPQKLRVGSLSQTALMIRGHCDAYTFLISPCNFDHVVLYNITASELKARLIEENPNVFTDVNVRLI